MKHLTFPTHVHMLPVNHGFQVAVVLDNDCVQIAAEYLNIIFNVDCTLSFFPLSIP